MFAWRLRVTVLHLIWRPKCTQKRAALQGHGNKGTVSGRFFWASLELELELLSHAILEERNRDLGVVVYACGLH